MKKNYIGSRFGKLVVLSEASPRIYERKGGGVNRKTRLLCKCDCGKTKKVMQNDLVSNRTTSCGCVQAAARKATVVHGFNRNNSTKRDLRFINIWRDMKRRCSLKGSHRRHYNRYGGRGISVCDEWLSFEGFRADMYVDYVKHCEEFSMKDTSIDRVDNNKNYEKNNCRWATQKEQVNNASSNVLIRGLDGRLVNTQELSIRTGIDRSLLRSRIRKGFSFEEVVFNGDLRHTNSGGRRPIRDGEYSFTGKGWASFLGISVSSFYYYKKKGLSPIEIKELIRKRKSLT